MSLFSLLYVLTPFVSAASLANIFVNPQTYSSAGDYSTNLAWPLGSTQTVHWVSNFSTYQLYMFQNNGVGDGDPVLISTG